MIEYFWSHANITRNLDIFENQGTHYYKHGQNMFCFLYLEL